MTQALKTFSLSLLALVGLLAPWAQSVLAQAAYPGDPVAVRYGIRGKALITSPESIPYAPGDLFLVDTFTGERELLDRGHDNFGPRFSPDGEEVVYTKNKRIVIHSLATGEKRDAGEANASVNWTRDGRLIHATTTRIQALDLATGETSTLFEKPPPHMVNLAASLDGWDAVWTQPQWSVWHVNLRDGSAQKIGDGCNGAISHDGRIGAVLEGSHYRIRLHDLDTMGVHHHVRTAIIRPDGQPEQIAGTRFSGFDARFLLYSSENYIRAVVYDLRSGTPHMVGPGLIWDFLPGESPLPQGVWPFDPEAVYFEIRGPVARLRPPAAEGAQRNATDFALAIHGDAEVDGEGLIRLRGGHVDSLEAGQGFAAVARARPHFHASIEGWITPLEASVESARRIVGLVGEGEADSWSLWQKGDRLLLRARPSEKEAGHEVDLGRLRAGEAHHVLLSFSPQGAGAYVDGRHVADGLRNAGVMRWSTRQALVFGGGSEAAGWQGDLSRFTVYARAPGQANAFQHALAFAPGAGDTEAPAALERQGLTDHPAKNLPWPSTEHGLVFSLERGNLPLRAVDAGGKALPAVTLNPLGMGRFDGDYGPRISHGGFVVEGVGEGITAAIAESQAFALEAWISADATPNETVEVVSIGDGNTGFQLLQQKANLLLRLPGHERPIPLHQVLPPKGHDLRGTAVSTVLTWADGLLTVYKNGSYLKSFEVPFDASAWKAEDLLLGSRQSLQPGFVGRVEGLALYKRALSPEEVAEAFVRMGARVWAAKTGDGLSVQARLTLMSDMPDLDRIAPYTRALALYEYEVTRVLKGPRDLAGKTIRVAHWALMDHRPMPIADARIGAEYILQLEPFDDQPYLQSQAISDNLEFSVDIPVHYDIRPPAAPLVEPAK